LSEEQDLVGRGGSDKLEKKKRKRKRRKENRVKVHQECDFNEPPKIDINIDNDNLA
jgi:hypothetical protein